MLLVPEVVPADVVQVVQEVVVVVLAVLAVLAAGGRVSPSYIAQSVILITSPSDKVYTNLGEKAAKTNRFYHCSVRILTPEFT